jgi:hypothetical protein
VDPERILMVLHLLPSLTDDSKMFGFILEYLKTKDEKIWKQLKRRYDGITGRYGTYSSTNNKVLGQEVRQNYF